MQDDQKRLFFAFEAIAHFPKLPPGRLIDESHRHATIAFLGNVSFTKVEEAIKSFPKPSFEFGLLGHFDKSLLLPEKTPHVVAWHVILAEKQKEVFLFHQRIKDWLEASKIPLANKDRELLLHVTLARTPFKPEKWEKAFTKIPVFLKNIHLYESKFGLKYEPIWSYPLKPPFIEIEHTADLAFKIYGKDYLDLYIHAKYALAIHYPLLLGYFQTNLNPATIDEVIFELNRITTLADHLGCCPFKAISYHSTINTLPGGIMEWEMIVDV